MKKKVEDFDVSKVPTKVFFDFVIDYHEGMCYAFSCEGCYKYTKVYPRVSYEQTQKYFHNKRGTDFNSVWNLAKKMDGFDKYFAENYTRYNK